MNGETTDRRFSKVDLKRQPSTLKRFKDDDDDFMDSDLDDEDGLSNFFLLTGCPDSGKTNLPNEEESQNTRIRTKRVHDRH